MVRAQGLGNLYGIMYAANQLVLLMLGAGSSIIFLKTFFSDQGAIRFSGPARPMKRAALD